MLGRAGHQLPRQTTDLIADWEKFRFAQDNLTGPELPLDEITLLAPVAGSQKVICIGRNYADHAAEMNSTVGQLPVVFNKLPSSLIGPRQPIRLPAVSQQVDYEAELVVVMGRGGRNIAQAHAMEHVFGYCCGNDVSARDWQKGSPGGQWLLGKSFDTFAPIGPWLVTRDEINADDLDIQLRLNGQAMQRSNTAQMIFKIDFLISHLSRVCTLAPGDLLFTGTPSGVGAGRNPPVFLGDGDRVEVEITGLGVLENPVVQEPP